jgi:hypothetical protein
MKQILERQQMPDGTTKTWPSNYAYRGKDAESGLHIFAEADDHAELFAYRHHGVAGWHLVRGKQTFEFCRSAETRP